MGRRRESLADVLLILPWWVSVVLAGIAYLGLTFIAPIWFSGNPVTAAVGKAVTHLTPVVCGLLLFLAVASFVRAKFIARKFDAQRGIDDLQALSWREFESIVGEAFRRRGYFVAENAVDGADGGIDLVVRKDGKKYFVQCKQWKSSKVGVKPIRELFGVMTAHQADGGFFVASGTYTQEARVFAKTTGIEIVDGKMLAEMVAGVRESKPSVDSTNRSATSSVAPFLRETEAPACPKCAGPMVARRAKRGASAGSQFWGCLKYPACRGTRAL